MEESGTGDASYDDGHGVRDVTDDLWGIYGDTDELRMGTHDVRSIADAGDVLELLGPAVRTLRDTSPNRPRMHPLAMRGRRASSRRLQRGQRGGKGHGARARKG